MATKRESVIEHFPLARTVDEVFFFFIAMEVENG